MRWKHLKSGGFYEILAHALNEADLQPVIVYRKVDGDHVGSTWVRSAAEFMDGRFVPEPAAPKDESEPDADSPDLPRSIPRMSKIEAGDTVYLDRTLEIPKEVQEAWDAEERTTIDVVQEIESNWTVLLLQRKIFFPIKYLKKVQEP